MFFTLSNTFGYKIASDILAGMLKTFADKVRKCM